MNYWTARIIDYVIIVPFITGLFRFRKVDDMFHPFFYLLFYYVFNEFVLFEILSRVIHTNSINYNIYWVVIFFLIIYQLKKWELLCLGARSEKLLYGAVVVFWIWDNLYHSTLWNFNSLSKIVLCFVLTVLNVRAIGHLSVRTFSFGLRKAMFLICSTLIFEFTVKIIGEIFWQYGLIRSTSFQNNVILLESLSGVLVATIFTIAIIWMPKKREYTWLSP